MLSRGWVRGVRARPVAPAEGSVAPRWRPAAPAGSLADMRATRITGSVARRAALAAALCLAALAAPAQASIYWTDWSSDTLARANADGSGVNEQFVTNIVDGMSLAVD